MSDKLSEAWAEAEAALQKFLELSAELAGRADMARIVANEKRAHADVAANVTAQEEYVLHLRKQTHLREEELAGLRRFRADMLEVYRGGFADIARAIRETKV